MAKLAKVPSNSIRKVCLACRYPTAINPRVELSVGAMGGVRSKEQNEQEEPP